MSGYKNLTRWMGHKKKSTFVGLDIDPHHVMKVG